MPCFTNYAIARFAAASLIAPTLLSGSDGLPQRTNDKADFNERYFVAVTDRGGTSLRATVWDVRRGAVVRRIDGHREGLRSVHLSPDGRDVLTSSHRSPGELAIPSSDNSIRLWNLATGKQRLYIPDATYGRFSLDGKRILGLTKRVAGRTGADAFDVAAWDARTGKRLFTAAVPDGGAYPAYTFTLQEAADAPRLVFQQSGPPVVYDSLTGVPVGLPMLLALHSDGAFIPPNGEEVQLAELGGVSYHSVASGKETLRVPYHGGYAWVIGWRRDGQGFAAASHDGRIISYDRGGGRTATALTGGGYPDSVLPGPDGGRFIVNWKGGNAIPRRRTCFNAETCATLWESEGSVVGFTTRGEVVLMRTTEGSNRYSPGERGPGPWSPPVPGMTEVSIRDAASGRVIRKFATVNLED